MIKILKINENTIIENFEPVVQEVVAFDEQGNPAQFQERWIIPKDPIELSKLMADTLVWLSRKRLNQILDRYDYNSLGDVQLYASQNDTEAKALLSWYQAYDTAIWDYIAQNFEPVIQGTQQATVEQLLQSYSDLRAIEEEIFNQSLQASSLP